jgi:perosamine synthetase
MNKLFFLHEPKIHYHEKKNVLKSLNSGWISPSGKNVGEFEKKLSKLVKSKLALTNSGTSALHLSLILSDVQKGDEVLVPSATFIASVNVILYLGAKPIFFDNSKNSLNGDIDKILTFIKKETFSTTRGTFNKKTKKRIKALIFTHVFGNVSNLSLLKKKLKKKKIKLIEDAAEAVGSFLNNKTHAGTQGDYGVLSFNTNKIITTSSGGAILLKSIKDYNRAKILISQGKSDNLFFIHKEVGYNYGMSNINAGIGIGQLKSLKKIISFKKKIHERYYKNFKDNEKISLLNFEKKTKPNFWLNALVVKEYTYSKLKKVIRTLNSQGIQVRPLWFPCHKQSFLKKFQRYNLINVNEYHKKILCLPSSFFLKMSEIDYISNMIKKILKKK